jgi:RHS repeat-associated protein
VQDLSYAYDPVGNIVRICDAAQATTFWRNQKIAPARIYGYDALYQLISATGREMATRAQQSQTLPPAAIPLPSDDMVYTNYSRTYSYDRGGNLTQIQHQGVASYTQAIVVSNRSNHAVQQNAKGTLTPDGIDGSNGTWFDASGNQQQLLPDQTQPLTWNGRNELTRVTLLRRSGADGENDDREVYQYGEDGIRVRKRMTTQAKSVTRTVEAIYLPGLTLRVTSSGDGKTMTVTESLEEISSSAAGNIHVRCLHWAMGLPASLTNDLVRYGVGDRSGSIGLELDDHANAISREEYYPYGGTAVWTARSLVEADTKYVRYSGKERDATGLYEYGYRYYQPWIGRWLSPDPAGLADGLNLYRMVHNDPVSLRDMYGLAPGRKRNAEESIHELAESVGHDVGSNEEGGHAARPAAALEPETIASILGDAIKASYSYFPLKSYNKSYLDTSNLTGYKAWFYSDGIREARARITDKLISTTKNLDSESEVFGVIKRSRMAGKALAGNCGLLSTPAFFYLLEKRERLNQLFHKDVNISIVDLEDPYDHTFISVNHPAGAWGPLSSNTKEWPADTWIVDPWAKIVSPANEYEERWTAKLQKWADRGLAIGGADGNHMTDPKWRDAIRNSEKVVAYSDEMERKYG